MWVFMNDAFFSAVEHRDDPSKVMVRSRFKGDLETVFNVTSKEVEVTENADYRFRIVVTKEKLKEEIAAYIDGCLVYDNFKSSIKPKDKWRYNAYSSVWTVLYNLQNAMYGARDWIGQYRTKMHRLPTKYKHGFREHY